MQENCTTVRSELLAGLTTFMTMAYVVVVNPQILSESGMPVNGALRHAHFFQRGHARYWDITSIPQSIHHSL